MDPVERLTAEQALQHPFFERCEGSQAWNLTPRQRFRVSLSVSGSRPAPLPRIFLMVTVPVELTPPPFLGGSVDRAGRWTGSLKRPPYPATDQECAVEGPLRAAASAAPDRQLCLPALRTLGEEG